MFGGGMDRRAQLMALQRMRAGGGMGSFAPQAQQAPMGGMAQAVSGAFGGMPQQPPPPPGAFGGMPARGVQMGTFGGAPQQQMGAFGGMPSQAAPQGRPFLGAPPEDPRRAAPQGPRTRPGYQPQGGFAGMINRGVR